VVGDVTLLIPLARVGLLARVDALAVGARLLRRAVAVRRAAHH
jgi:hypothetical protein